MAEFRLAFLDQSLPIEHPDGLADDLSILFGDSAVPGAPAKHRLRVDVGPGGRFSIALDGEPPIAGLDRGEILAKLQDEVVYALAVDAAGAVMLHAGAVLSDDRVVLIAGPTGSGKSSLAAWFAANGFRYWTDELVALGNDAALSGLPRAMVLKGAAAAIIDRFAAFAGAPRREAADGRLMLRPLDTATTDAGQRPGLILFPRFEPGASASITPLTAAQTGMRLMACNLNARNLPEEGFVQVTSLARSAPGFVLRFGDFDCLDGVADKLAAIALRHLPTPAAARRFAAAFTPPLPAPAPSLPAASLPVPAATAARARRPLTIGMATYDDYDGVYFTIQSIRLHHPEIVDETNFLVIDNHPDGRAAQPLKDLEAHIPNYRYVPLGARSGTAVRDAIFGETDSPFVLCLDCHVLVVPRALRRLLDYFAAHPETPDLLQGPLLSDDLSTISTHFHPEWRAGMYGYWQHDTRADDIDGEPFEIPMQGLGLFACRAAAWPGFNPLFRGFGGEEGYIHEKFRRAGGRTLCLPYLRWLHRFARPMGVPYPNRWEDRIRNYLIGFREVGLPTEPMVEHFRSHIGAAEADRLIAAAEASITEAAG